MPQVESYNGSKDPLDHLESFKTMMHLQGVPNEIMCWAFPITLKGPVRIWYSRLTPNSINTFKELGTQFVSHFIGGHQYKKSTACLMSIKQREDETLRSYISRFNKEALSIDEANDKILVAAFINHLRKGKEGCKGLYRVLVDNESSVDILYYPAFQKMGIGRERLIPTNVPLVGFEGTRVYPLGVVTLSVTTREYPQQITKDVVFLVVDCSSAYNAILERPTLNAWKVVTSTYHLMVKFPTEYGVGELHKNQVAARECYVAIMEMNEHLQAMNIEEQRMVAKPVEELEEVHLDDYRPERTIRIGTLASQTVPQALTIFLKENQDVFAWSHEDIPGIDPSVMVHKLNVSSSFSPVRQKKRVYAPEQDRAIVKEVQKLQEADFIRKVYYLDWLANGIEVNPEKVKAIIELSPPRTVKEVQSLNGKVAALNRFVSRATDKCLPFFRTLKRSFECTDECQKAFEDLKVYLSASPLLSPSMPGEELFLYLAISSAAVSAALIKEEDKVQRLVYFISRALRGAEERYPQMEKLAFTLVTIAQKLKPCFQVHTINVLTDKPLRKVMSSPEATGRMALWAIELSEFDIQYQPRAAMKGQILVDFIVEYTIIKDRGAEETPMWRLHTDRSSNKHARGVVVVLHTSEGDKIKCMIRLDFSTTNNEVEY
ncbi:uncharacterized protein LOC142628679 [Castanea sativa]|uniref:uncharacterized protein LOC142628679 n=1 Tax=Castanea sativa TaxID=21020 RepID=UPI003F654769